MSTSVKTCFKCQEEKPLTEFYKHSEMGDGHLNKCKCCAKKDAMEHRQNNLERIKAYDRNRPNKEQRSIAGKHYQKTGRGAAIARAARKRWEQNNPHKKQANVTVSNAVRDGKLEKEPCFICGAEAEAHHSAYDLPLHVTWLCNVHHKQVHKEHRDYLRSIGF